MAIDPTQPGAAPASLAGFGVSERGQLPTEARERSFAAIDALPTEQMLRLINTQDAEVPALIRRAIPRIALLVDAVAALMHIGGRLIYCGAGVGGRVAALDAADLASDFDARDIEAILAGGDAALRGQPTGAHQTADQEDDATGPRDAFDAIAVGPNDAVLCVDPDGVTPWCWGALRLANQRRCLTAMLCCVPAQMLMRRERAPLVAGNAVAPAPPPKPKLPTPVDHLIDIPVGAEVIPGSTRLKAASAMKLTLNMISTALMVKLGHTWGHLMVDLKPNNERLRDRAIRLIAEQCMVPREQAQQLLDAAGDRVKAAIVMGRKGVSRDEAEALLDQHEGRLRAILGEPR